MKHLFTILTVIATTSWLSAQTLELPAPAKTGGMPLMEALAKRSSARSHAGRELTSQQLSNLLWAGFGVNRPDGKRTAPSAHNNQAIAIHVLLKDGAYVYDAANNRLRQLAAADLRADIGNANAPVVLLYVADLGKGSDSMSARRSYAAVDSGFIGQNVYLYCASEGLATVYRGGFNGATVASRLGLRAEQQIVGVQPVGFPAESR